MKSLMKHNYDYEGLKEQDYVSYQDLAGQMLEGKDAKQVLSALLRHVYDDEFLPESYNEIADVKVKIEDNTRLFIALGTKSGYNNSKLLDMLNQKAKVPGRKIRDIKIMETYSFITTPLEEAEKIIKALNRDKSKKPLVEKANSNKDSNGGGNNRRRSDSKDSRSTRDSGERGKKSDSRKSSSKDTRGTKESTNKNKKSDSKSTSSNSKSTSSKS